MADNDEPQNVEPVDGEPKKGQFGTGFDPRRGTTGGRPKKLVEIERMLDAEHRTVDNMREVFTRLKELAMEDMITASTDEKGVEHIARRPPNPAFMSLYLERTLGPAKELDIDLTNASDETIRFLAENGVRTN